MQNCYSKGSRITREQLHDQDDRLTNKHIQTLGFLQEIVNENKALKAKIQELEEQTSKCSELHALAEKSQDRIKEIQEQYLKRADEINDMLIKQHQAEMQKDMLDKDEAELVWKTERLLLLAQIEEWKEKVRTMENRLMRQIEEKLEAERKWMSEKNQLRDEMDRLKQSNQALQAQIDFFRKNEGKVDMLNLKLESIQQEVERYKEENNRLKQVNTSQANEIQKLQKAKAELSDELKAAQQSNKEMRFRIAQLEKDLSDLQNDKSKDELIEQLRKKLTKLHKEKQEWNSKEKDYEDIIEKLQAHIAQLKSQLEESEYARQQMQLEIEKLLKEIERLRKKIGADRSFKNFVDLKRELNYVKDENDDLREKVKVTPTLPLLKPDTSILTRPSSGRGEKRLVKKS